MNIELEQMTQRWSTAWLEHDAAQVEAMMAPEYAYVAADGEVLTRDQILEIIGSPDYALAWGGRSEVSVTPVASDCAIVTSRSTGAGTFHGRRFRGDLRCSSVFVRRADRWLVVHEHCSRLVK